MNQLKVLGDKRIVEVSGSSNELVSSRGGRMELEGLLVRSHIRGERISPTDEMNFRRLIELDGSLDDLLESLGDPPENGRIAPESGAIEARHIRNVLTKYIEGALSRDEVETWANEVERYLNLQGERAVQGVLHTLANPSITKELNKEIAGELLGKLH